MDFTNTKDQDPMTLAATETPPDPNATLVARLAGAPSNIIIEAYMKLRAEKAELDNKYKTDELTIKSRMDLIERALGLRMMEDGVTSIKTAKGTAFSQIKRHCQCGDWPSFGEWVIKNNRTDLFQKRLNNAAILEIAKDTGELPPGVQVVSETEVTIRKA